MTQRRYTERQAAAIFRAWLIDRSYRYELSSVAAIIMEQIAAAVDEGDPFEAYRAGELDDLLHKGGEP
jgi:hypothetical protein